MNPACIFAPFFISAFCCTDFSPGISGPGCTANPNDRARKEIPEAIVVQGIVYYCVSENQGIHYLSFPKWPEVKATQSLGK